MEQLSKNLKLIFFFLFHLFCLIVKTQAHTNGTSSPPPGKSGGFSAIFVFGDSTVDPGNNNYIDTLVKANFPPYGRDFPGKKATGRFSNGLLFPDFIASYVGLKDHVPPYLNPKLTTEELLTGVSFASAGTGFTSKFDNVIPVMKQLEYFKEYKRRIEAKIGKNQTEEHIKRAIFVISAGSNDFVINYFSVPIRRLSYNVSRYQQFVLRHQIHFLQSLWLEGARKMLVLGLPPFGCLPEMISLKSPTMMITRRHCLNRYSVVGKNYNNLLQNKLTSMQNNLTSLGAQISYVDTYDLASDIVQNPSKYGFVRALHGCCATGNIEASYLCNPLKLPTTIFLISLFVLSSIVLS